MSDLPAPLSPADCDLRGYDFMPLYGHRLFHSDLYEDTTPEEFKIAVKLWWEAWNQCPAGSLPSSDAKLRRLADLGHDTKTWERVKKAVLRGFVLCSDERLYHRWLCEWAKEAYAKRVDERERKRRYREKLKRDADGDGGASHSRGDGDNPPKGQGLTTQKTGQSVEGTSQTAIVPDSLTRTGTWTKAQGQDRTGEEERKEKDSKLAFPGTYPAREAEADASPIVFFHPSPPEPPDPRRFPTKGGTFASTVNHDPYGQVRSLSEQLDAIRPAPLPDERPAFRPREPERTVEEQLAALREEKSA